MAGVDGRGGTNELGGVKVGESLIRICCTYKIK